MSFFTPIARGDEAALARLYDAYRVILFGLLVRILNSREEAEDILQEVLCRCGGGRKILMKSVAGHLPGWSRSRAAGPSIVSGSWRASTSGAGAAQEQEQIEDVSDALTDAVRAEQQTSSAAPWPNFRKSNEHTLVLAYFDGLTQSEIASKLERSPRNGQNAHAFGNDQSCARCWDRNWKTSVTPKSQE